jgi:osmotically inducible protein OsmC
MKPRRCAVLPRLKRHSCRGARRGERLFILVRRLPQAPLHWLLNRKVHCARLRLARIITVTVTKGEKTMATRTGSAVWEGTLKEGRGTMKLGSGAFEGPYSFSSRFEEAKGTNPEELIGAAEAGCFSMALSANLEKAGHPAKRISTTATVKLEMVGGGPKITTIDVKTEAEVPGIDDAKFREQAEHTKKTCPVSVVLAGAQINLDAKLVR